jgi:hypothetical protein
MSALTYLGASPTTVEVPINAEGTHNYSIYFKRMSFLCNTCNSPHNKQLCALVLKSVFDDSIISRGSRPPRSPVLNPHDFLFVVHDDNP